MHGPIRVYSVSQIIAVLLTKGNSLPLLVKVLTESVWFTVQDY